MSKGKPHAFLIRIYISICMYDIRSERNIYQCLVFKRGVNLTECHMCQYLENPAKVKVFTVSTVWEQFYDLFLQGFANFRMNFSSSLFQEHTSYHIVYMFSGQNFFGPGQGTFVPTATFGHATF